jgi:hypothetical protein
MVKKIIFGVFVLIVFTTCQNGNKNSDKAKEISNTNRIFSKTYKTDTYSFTIESNNEEISTLKAYSKGMDYDYNESIEIEGMVKESYMLDINQDSYKEFILTIAPTDDSGNIELFGFASNKGKSISTISVQELDILRDVDSDSIFIKGNSIIRKFQSQGKNITCQYQLLAGEAGYMLKANKLK